MPIRAQRIGITTKRSSERVKKDGHCAPPTQLFTRSPCAAIHDPAASAGLAPFSVASMTLSISPGFH
jgi:hypothetical protein